MDDDELIMNTANPAHRDEVIDIIAKDDVAVKKDRLEVLKLLFANNADPKIGTEIAVLEDELREDETLMAYFDKTRAEAKNKHVYPYDQNDSAHIN
jgi:hypothetical protein